MTTASQTVKHHVKRCRSQVRRRVIVGVGVQERAPGHGQGPWRATERRVAGRCLARRSATGEGPVVMAMMAWHLVIAMMAMACDGYDGLIVAVRWLIMRL